jgi:hypothetical protein
MKTRDKGGRPGHAPDDRSRQMVEVMSGFGIPQDKIADVARRCASTTRRNCNAVRRRSRRSSSEICSSSPAAATERRSRRSCSPCNAGSDGRSMRRLRRSRSGRSARRSSCRWRLRPRTPAIAGANCCSDRLDLRLRRLGAAPQGKAGRWFPTCRCSRIRLTAQSGSSISSAFRTSKVSRRLPPRPVSGSAISSASSLALSTTRASAMSPRCLPSSARRTRKPRVAPD